MSILLASTLIAALDFGIQPLPEDSKFRKENFTKYTEIIAPNGKSIPIIAQQGVRDIAIARAKNLLQFFLTDVPNSEFGKDKSAVANAMANNKALLMMPEGAHREGREPRIEAQPLYESETPIDGSQWYIKNNWEHRDAAFEEIFHLVHDTGIGTYLKGALPHYQTQLKVESRKALNEHRWGIPVDPHVKQWIEELRQEQSLAQEYIASVLDSYYGLWAAFDEEPGGMWGVYIAKTREEIKTKDPNGLKLIEAFLPPMMYGYEALIDPSFNGTFYMQLNDDFPYTFKSQYLVDVTLNGKTNANILGNKEDNTFKGNAGNNIINGGDGYDTVIFEGVPDEYEISTVGSTTKVKDLKANRGGIDTLISIEQLQFKE